MIYIGLGSNLPSVEYGDSIAILTAALDRFHDFGMVVRARSPWYRSRPVPPSAQPWFVNGVAAVESGLEPAGLLAALHRLEACFGRVRGERNQARTIDLDLLDYNGRIAAGTGPGEPVLPHPRLHERAFVLRPLRDLAPAWRHPVSGLDLRVLLGRLGPDQAADRIDP